MMLSVGENTVVVEATDAYGNRSSRTIVISRQEQVEESDIVDVESNIPNSSYRNPDAVAVIIDISRYKNSDVPNIDFANRDGQVMKEYVINVFGYSEKRIIHLTNENATLTEFRKTFEQKLSNYIKPYKTDVFVYYVGHGVPDTKTSEAYFAPYDCDPNYAKQTAFPVSQFYQELNKLPARSITIVLDACFSGQSPSGNLVKNISAAILRIKNPIVAIPNSVVFASSGVNEISNWLPQKKHSLFTYYFMKALQGYADKNKDKQLTVGEIEDFLKEHVSDDARTLNREQNPETYSVDKSRVLVKYE